MCSCSGCWSSGCAASSSIARALETARGEQSSFTTEQPRCRSRDDDGTATSGQAQPDPRAGCARSTATQSGSAVAGAMAEQGYVATSVAEVLRRAGVSRGRLYQQFSSKEDCFAAAYEQAVTLLISRIMALTQWRGGHAGGVSSRIEYLLGAYLDGLAGPTGVREGFPHRGVAPRARAAIARRAEMQEMFVVPSPAVLGAHSPEQRFACQRLAVGRSARWLRCDCLLPTPTVAGLRGPADRHGGARGPPYGGRDDRLAFDHHVAAGLGARVAQIHRFLLLPAQPLRPHPPPSRSRPRRLSSWPGR